MNIHNASLTISAVQKTQYPAPLSSEVAFAGRSNVGKSSLINKLLNRKSLAHTSSKPGKTATINFYNIDNELYLVDLPGYGYAQVSKEEKKKWAEMIETYLATRENLTQVVLLVDARHKPTADDCVMADYIRRVCSRMVVVATKCDKIAKSKLQEQILTVIRTLKLSGEDIIIPFSAENGMGVDEFWYYVEDILEIPVKK